MKTFSAWLLIAAWVMPSAHAEKNGAIQRSGESDLPTIRAQVGFTNLIELPPNQEIAEVTIGDKDFWVVEGKGRFVHVKPTKPGLTTNLNIIVKGDAVYPFLLKEITKSAGKEKPDLRVKLSQSDEERQAAIAVNEEVAKLRRDKDHAEEAMWKAEQEAKALKERMEAEKARAQKKTENEPPPVQAAGGAPKPVPEGKPVTEPLQAAQGVTAAVAPGAAATTPSVKDPVYRSVTWLEPPMNSEGLIRKSGRAISRLFRRVSRALHVY